MRSNFLRVTHVMRTKSVAKPTAKVGGAKRKAWSFNDRRARILTGRVTVINPNESQ